MVNYYMLYFIFQFKSTFFQLLTSTISLTSSVSPGITDVDTDTGSQSSVGAGVGVGVGAAGVLLVVVGVLGVGLFCMWKRRHASKVVLSPPLAAVGNLDNPVYESKWELYSSTNTPTVKFWEKINSFSTS